MCQASKGYNHIIRVIISWVGKQTGRKRELIFGGGGGVGGGGVADKWK